MNTRFALALLTGLTPILLLISCSGSGGSDRPTVAEAREAITGSTGSEAALDAVIAALVKGYSLEQIVDAGFAGTLNAEGDITAVGGGTASPSGAPFGTVTKDLQVQLDTRFVTVQDSFFEALGIDFNLDPVDIPLNLSEQGYDVIQIIDGTALQRITQDTQSGRLSILDQQNQPVVPTLPLQFVLTIEGNEFTAPDPGPMGDPDMPSPNFTVEPLNLNGEYIGGESSCPTDFGSFTVMNLLNESLQIEIRSASTALSLREGGTILLGGLQTHEVGVDFNCSTMVPFIGQIPVVGRLFRNGTPGTESKELLVLVNASIVPSAE